MHETGLGALNCTQRRMRAARSDNMSPIGLRKVLYVAWYDPAKYLSACSRQVGYPEFPRILLSWSRCYSLSLSLWLSSSLGAALLFSRCSWNLRDVHCTLNRESDVLREACFPEQQRIVQIKCRRERHNIHSGVLISCSRLSPPHECVS